MQLKISYDELLEESINDIEALLKKDYSLSKRSIALLLLQSDEDITKRIREDMSGEFDVIDSIVQKVGRHYGKSLNYVISVERQKAVDEIMRHNIRKLDKNKRRTSEILSRLTMNPLTGIPILILVLYFGLYKFVGGFGAGTLVNFLENDIFLKYINPWVDKTVTTLIPWQWLQELLVRDYGIITLGFRYAVAIILPIVGAFFLMFSMIEDSGYLPRLAMLVDRIFKKIGLNGRAVIPMVLGFGCDTMATMVSRTLETKRERVIATFLLSLAIPCSAQLGVILALLSGLPAAMSVWVIFMTLVFLLIGWFTSKVMPGEKPVFYMEVPPLRLPRLSNVFIKTYTRLQWYFVEILPVFIAASVLIWLGNITGLFSLLIDLLKPVVHVIGLPDEAARTFLFGFLRRDYGAAGLYDLQKAGALTPRQLTVAAVTLTLFLPCVAQLTMNIKERGLKTALGMAAFIFPFAFLCGYLLNLLLKATGVMP